MGKKRNSLGRGLASILGNNHLTKNKENGTNNANGNAYLINQTSK